MIFRWRTIVVWEESYWIWIMRMKMVIKIRIVFDIHLDAVTILTEQLLNCLKDIICLITIRTLLNFLIITTQSKSIFISMAKRNNAKEYIIFILVKISEIAMIESMARIVNTCLNLATNSVNRWIWFEMKDLIWDNMVAICFMLIYV